MELRDNPVVEQVQEGRQRLGAVATLCDLVREVGRHARIDTIKPQERRPDNGRQAGLVVVDLDCVDFTRREPEPPARTEPHRLIGLGFYRGTALLDPPHSLIASYRPPPPPPSTIELDSLALFKSGSAVLNPGSNRIMIGALEMIKAHPDKRVLVAGHSDAVGNARANLKLSEARAASVRDWLADAAGLPITHFAIQGYGDTRPKAPNDTEAGRAANRRVEITLIPDCRDDRRGGQASSGHPACSFQSKE